jgi:metal-responsive CopG/Arc/MetJ family transcriptional regulator
MSDQLTRTSITLPKDLKRKARVKATLEDTNLSEVIRGLLTQWIKGEEQEQSQKTEAKD